MSFFKVCCLLFRFQLWVSLMRCIMGFSKGRVHIGCISVPSNTFKCYVCVTCSCETCLCEKSCSPTQNVWPCGHGYKLLTAHCLNNNFAIHSLSHSYTHTALHDMIVFSFTIQWNSVGQKQSLNWTFEELNCFLSSTRYFCGFVCKCPNKWKH